MRTPLLVTSAVVFWIACGDFKPTPVPQNQRTVTLRISPPSPSEMPPGQSANRPSLQLAALRIVDGQIAPDGIFVGRPEDVLDVESEDWTDRPITVAVPRDEAVAIFVQTPRNNLQSLGRLLIKLEMAAPGRVTTLIPAGQDNIDLGVVSLVGTNFSFGRVHTLRIDDEHNPWSARPMTEPAGAELSSLPDTNGSDDGDGVPDQLE